MNVYEFNNILYDNKSRFSKIHLTTHAIITLVESVSKALDTGKIILGVGVYLDLYNAFDTLGHQLLFKSYMQLLYKQKYMIYSKESRWVQY